MQDWTPHDKGHHEQALDELRHELREFAYDGLIQLCDDLDNRAVVRGSWSGCVMSYRNGAAGSARRDRHGRARNAFTVLWDGGWLTDEEVARIAREELSRRDAKPLPLRTPRA